MGALGIVLAAVGLVPFFHLYGCSAKQGVQIAGKWKETIPAGSAPGPTSLDIEFRPDQTFASGPEGKLIEGTWSVEDGALEMRITKIGGLPLDDMKKQMESQGATVTGNIGKAQSFTVSPDGNTLTPVEPKLKTAGLLIVRSQG